MKEIIKNVNRKKKKEIGIEINGIMCVLVDATLLCILSGEKLVFYL